jgi:hypothetical protein
MTRLAPTAAIALALSVAAAPTAASDVGGAYVYRGASSGSVEVATAGSTGWRAGAVEATLRPLGGVAGSAGLVMHYQDAANHYLFLVSTNSDALMIYKSVAGAYTLLGSVPHPEPLLGAQHVLRGEDDGEGNLTLVWDGEPVLTVFDRTFTAGAAGLRVWAMTADFDDVLVEERGGAVLLFDDFEDGVAEGWSAGPAWSVVETGPPGPPMPIPMIETSFEGGNGEITLVDPDNWTVFLRPQLEGTSPYRAWFFLRLSNLSDERPTHLVFQSVAFFTRPWYSYDRISWNPLPGSGSNYSITFEEDAVWLAHSIPYLTTDKDRLISDVAGPLVSVDLLATSEGGLPVEVLAITGPGGSAGKCGVWLTARHHAWEASGSWVADELVRWLVSEDPQAASVRRGAVVHVVPIMDVDNVVLGGSGKDQQPVDFNRDWRDEPYWSAVSAAIDAIDAYASSDRYDLFIDSHCPGSATTFLAVQPKELVPVDYWFRFTRFRQRLSLHSGTYSGAFEQWGPSYHPLWYRMSFWHQFSRYPQLGLSLTLETAVGSRAAYRDLARGLGRTIGDFLPCTRK